MKYAQKVKKRYLTILNDMAKNRDSYVKNPEKDFTRKRKLSFQDTINTIVTYDAGSIGRCIKRYIPKVEKTPTTSAFLQQQKKLKLSAFQTLFYRFNDPFPDKTLYNLHILSVDGTGVTVPMDRINENKEYARVLIILLCLERNVFADFPQVIAQSEIILEYTVEGCKTKRAALKLFLPVLLHGLFRKRRLQEGTVLRIFVAEIQSFKQDYFFILRKIQF